MTSLETFGNRPPYDEAGDLARMQSPIRPGRCTRRVVLGATLWNLGVVMGCGQSSGPQITEEQRSKQQVVQEKMKEYMQNKMQKGRRPGP
jgi:hypothetical protein